MQSPPSNWPQAVLVIPTRVWLEAADGMGETGVRKRDPSAVGKGAELAAGERKQKEPPAQILHILPHILWEGYKISSPVLSMTMLIKALPLEQTAEDLDSWMIVRCPGAALKECERSLWRMGSPSGITAVGGRNASPQPLQPLTFQTPTSPDGEPCWTRPLSPIVIPSGGQTRCSTEEAHKQHALLKHPKFCKG